MSHIVDRQTITWGTYGRNGDEPRKEILIKDISDEHLDNIITFILHNINIYKVEMLHLMRREKEYRMEHGISVPDYIKINDFKFFKN